MRAPLPPSQPSGLEELQWRSESIDAFLRDALELVRDLDGVLATLKDNVRRTQVRGAAVDCWVCMARSWRGVCCSGFTYLKTSRAHSGQAGLLMPLHMYSEG